MKRLLVAAGLLGCRAPVPSVEPPAPAPTPFASLEAALPVLCAAFAAEGLPCSDVLRLEYHQPTDVLSGIDTELHILRMQPPPAAGEGTAYWANWSTILAAGAWHPTFASDDDARELATALLVSVMAHELGHHLAESRGCGGSGLVGELVADDLSVDLVAKLLPRHAEMRALADEMIAAVPAHAPVPADLDAWARTTELPYDTPLYAAMHLDRQRRVLADPARGPRVRAACKRHHAERMAARSLVSTQVETARTIEKRSTTLAFDPAGHYWRIEDDLPDRHIALFFEEEPEPRTVVMLPGSDSPSVSELAILDAEHFAVHTRVKTYVIEGRRAVEVPTPLSIKLAYDEAGTLYQGVRDRDTWTVSPVGGAPRWRLALSADNTRWQDGPLAGADGMPGSFAVRAGRVAFSDLRLDAIRAIDDERVVTLAGSLPGHLDGPGADARFYHPTIVGFDAEGRLHVLDWDGRERVIYHL